MCSWASPDSASVLNDAKVVARRPDGTAAYYSVSDPSLTQICDLVCDRLRDQVADEARTFAIR